MKFPYIYLASASPRRHELLNQIGVPHEILNVPPPPGEDEPILPGESPIDYVRRTALHKAEWASTWLQQEIDQARRVPYPILTADTTVALHHEILGKPTNPEDAKRILSKLSGQTHQVYTAVVLVHDGQIHQSLSVSEVSFAHLVPSQIEHYINTGEVFGKAGAYGIQGYAATFIQHLSGSYSGVMGLPVFETANLLSGIG